MIVKLLTEHHLEFLSVKGGCTGSSESTLVKMSNCWKSHVTAQNFISYLPSDDVLTCYLQINVKMTTTVGILTFTSMSRIIFVLS